MKIGIDVGGSHIGLGIVSEKGEIILKKEQDYLRREKDMSLVVLSTILKLINEVLSEGKIDKIQIESIGIACPGTVSDGIIAKAENLGIENFNIAEELKKHIDIPIYLENDAKCAAIAEKKYGSLRSYEDAVFLIIGTGVGGAVFLNGQLLKPKRYSAFEVGHMVIQKDGEKCNCGRYGCFESYSSMKKIKEKVKEEFKLESIDGIQIKEFMIKNIENERLDKLLDTYVEYLTIGIANLINIFEPEVISIGGSFAHYKEVLLEKLKNKLAEKTELYNKDEVPKILLAELKNDAGIIGAAGI